VTAPPSSGTYKLVVDMVQEGYAWFAAKGSKILSYDIVVE
jgi:hypothetical protein